MILFRSGPGTAGEVAVFDAAGRRVRTFLQGEWGGSVGGVIAWDGRDAAGHRVPSGMYWVRLAAGSATRSTSLAIIR
jgi:flagellar hook assembly protein FlgD